MAYTRWSLRVSKKGVISSIAPRPFLNCCGYVWYVCSRERVVGKKSSSCGSCYSRLSWIQGTGFGGSQVISAFYSIHLQVRV
jgi:hypothetical protein